MLSTKRTLSFFLGMHILLFTLPNFFVTLFMIIYYLSLYLFVPHFSSLFSTNLFFSLQNLLSWIFCVIFLFLIYSLSFSLNFYWVSFTEWVRERKSRAREKTMKITQHYWFLDAQIKVMVPWFSWTLPTMKITLATSNTTSSSSSLSLSMVASLNASLKVNVNLYNTKFFSLKFRFLGFLSFTLFAPFDNNRNRNFLYRI